MTKIRNEISYIVQCKQNYFDGIYPADPNAKEEKGYQTLIDIAKFYFENDLYDDFAQYFMEGQYLIQLWTAHLILEYGQPDHKLKNRCLEEIVNYSDNPLAPNVAIQEKQWLESYFNSNA